MDSHFFKKIYFFSAVIGTLKKQIFSLLAENLAAIF